MKRALPLGLSIIFLLIITPHIVKANTFSGQYVSLSISPDTNSSVGVIHKFLVTGSNNENLISSLSINLPFRNVSMQSVKVSGKPKTFQYINNKLSIQLGEDLLKKGYKASITLNYIVRNVISTSWGYKIFKFPNPTNGKQFQFTLKNNSVHNKILYINTPNAITSGTLNTKLLVVLGETNINAISYQLSYKNVLNNTILPIISDKLGINTILENSGFNIASIDSSGNLFIVSNDQDISIKGNLLFYKDINELPFQEITFNQKPKSFEGLIARLQSVQISNITDYNVDYRDIDYRKNKLNNIEFAMLTSKLLSQLNIPNKVVYGVVKYPTGKTINHFWVEYRRQNKSMTLDIFTNKIMGINNEISYPIRLPFGTLKYSNLKNLINISYLGKVTVDNVRSSSKEFSTDIGDKLFIDLIHIRSDNILVIQNDSSYFLKIMGADIPEINKEIRNITIPPHTKQNMHIFYSGKTSEITFKFEINKLDISKTYTLKNNIDVRNFYARIALVVFTVLSIILILVKFIVKSVTNYKIIHMIKNIVKWNK